MGEAVNSPLITVLLPVFNGAKEVRRSVFSILEQTYSNFELLIINDGSTDETSSILNQLTDPRIKLIHQKNLGLAATLNRGISLSHGKYIARQDHDDFSYPTRLEKQLAYMEEHSECALLGTRAEIWVGDTPTERAHDHPSENGVLVFELLFNNPFVHSSVMLRREALLEVGGYTTDPSRQPPEDYELWSRISRRFCVANLPERLVIYREIPTSISRTGANPFQGNLVNICAENLAFANNLDAPDEVSIDIAALTHSAFKRISATPDINQLCAAIIKAGDNLSHTFDCPEVKKMAEERARILFHQFMDFKAQGRWTTPLIHFVRSIGKKMRFIGKKFSSGI